MSIIYRKAVIEDAEIMAKLRAEFLCGTGGISDEAELEWAERANRNYFKKAIADKSFAAWLALDGGKIIATSGVCFYEAPPTFKSRSGKEAYIMNMYTLPGYRRKGIAAELLKNVVAEAKSRGHDKIWLSTTEMGRTLYERFGFSSSPEYMELH